MKSVPRAIARTVLRPASWSDFTSEPGRDGLARGRFLGYREFRLIEVEIPHNGGIRWRARWEAVSISGHAVEEPRATTCLKADCLPPSAFISVRSLAATAIAAALETSVMNANTPRIRRDTARDLSNDLRAANTGPLGDTMPHRVRFLRTEIRIPRSCF
jgi:hypothetical protein